MVSVPYWTTDPLSGISHTSERTQRPVASVANFDEHLLSLPQSHQRLLDGLQQVATDSQVWKTFRSRRRLNLATDGGLSSQRGTHG